MEGEIEEMIPGTLLRWLLVVLWMTGGSARGGGQQRKDGDAAFRAGDFDVAERHYRAAIREDNEDVQALSNLATALYHRYLHHDEVDTTSGNALDDITEIVTLYRRALFLRPTGNGAAMLNFNLGSALLKLGETIDAQAAFERALAIRPDFPAARQNLGALQQQIGALGDAEASYRKALASASLDAEKRSTARKNLWSLLKAQGRHEDLLASYRAELVLTPGVADIHNDIGALLHNGYARAHDGKSGGGSNYKGANNAKNLEDALGHYHAAIELDPNHSAHINIGLAEVHRQAEKAPIGRGAQKFLRQSFGRRERSSTLKEDCRVVLFS